MVHGAKNQFLNGNYTKSTNVHGKPAYFNRYTDYGIWFDGDVDDPDWIFSHKIDFAGGEYTYSLFMISDGNTNCPENLVEWEEYYNSQWQINPEASVRP